MTKEEFLKGLPFKLIGTRGIIFYRYQSNEYGGIIRECSGNYYSAYNCNVDKIYPSKIIVYTSLIGTTVKTTIFLNNLECIP